MDGGAEGHAAGDGVSSAVAGNMVAGDVGAGEESMGHENFLFDSPSLLCPPAIAGSGCFPSRYHPSFPARVPDTLVWQI